MTREVLPPRRRWLTLRSAILSGLLLGCTTGALIPVPPADPGPLTVWGSDTPTSWFARPAVLCVIGHVPLAPVWLGVWSCPQEIRQ